MPAFGDARKPKLVRTLAGAVALLLLLLEPSALAHPSRRPPHPARHAASPPSWTWSRYMTHVNWKRLHGLGCTLGRKVRRGRQTLDALVILDFGMPMKSHGRWGASLFGRFRRTYRIRHGVQAYARGYVDCLGHRPGHLELGIGTTNYGSHVGFRHGRAWARMVNRANAWAREKRIRWRVHFAGANDIETGWRGPGVTRQWIRGYATVARSPYYNFGAAGGCPPYGSCIGRWTTRDVWYAAWGSGVARPVPEIYANSGVNAEQWYRLSLYSVRHHGKPIHFAGVMTQKRSCLDERDPCWGISNHPKAGWHQFWHALNRDRRTAQRLRFVTDISWRN